MSPPLAEGQHPGLDTGQGLLAKQGAEACVARLVLLPGEAAQLPLQPDGGAADQGHPVLAGTLVEQVADGDVVGAVEHQLVAGQQGIEQRLVCEEGVSLHLEPGIEGPQRQGGGVHLVHADALVGVQHLALQVGELHPIEIHQGEVTDPGHRQVLAGGAAESPGAYHQHPRLLERLLPLEVERLEHYLAVVAKELGIAQDLAHSSSPEKGSTDTVSPAATLPRACSRTM